MPKNRKRTKPDNGLLDTKHAPSKKKSKRKRNEYNTFVSNQILKYHQCKYSTFKLNDDELKLQIIYRNIDISGYKSWNLEYGFDRYYAEQKLHDYLKKTVGECKMLPPTILRGLRDFNKPLFLFYGCFDLTILTPIKLGELVLQFRIYNISEFGDLKMHGTLMNGINNTINTVFNQIMNGGNKDLYCWRRIGRTPTVRINLVLFFIIFEYFMDYEDESWDALNNLNINDDVKGCIFDYTFDSMKWFKNNNIINRNKLIFITLVHQKEYHQSWLVWLCTHIWASKNDKKIIRGYIHKYNNKPKTLNISNIILENFQ